MNPMNPNKLGLGLGLGLSLAAATLLVVTPSRAFAQTDGSGDFPDEPEPQHQNRLDQCPTDVGVDREFGGNGPRVEFSANLVIAPDGKSLLSRNLFNARETGSGTRTEAEVTAAGAASGLHEEDVWSVTNDCLRIEAILTGDQTLINFTDNDHEEDRFFRAAPDYVSLLKVKGDTSGKDTDNCTNDDTKYHVKFMR